MAKSQSKGTTPLQPELEAARRTQALEEALQQINRQFGQGAIMRLGERAAGQQVPAISTGSLSVDIITGIGGVPRGRITEIFGMEASGKTTLALHIIAEAQKVGGVAAFVDAEHALDVAYARRLGVDVGELLLSQPDSGEQALKITEILVRSGAVDVIVVDSVAALVPEAELAGEMGDAHVGLQARLMSQALRKLTGVISKTRAAVVFINQIRVKIAMGYGGPGVAETTTGGHALKFYSSLRLDIRKGQKIRSGDQEVGAQARVKVVKNKLAPPFRTATIEIIYGQGINKLGELLDLGVQLELVKRSGTWYSYGSQRLGQGRENACRTLRENPELARELEEKIRSAYGLPPIQGQAPEEGQEDAAQS